MIGVGRRKALVEEIAVIGGLIGVQLVYAGNLVFTSYLMYLGCNPLSLVILTSFATFLILSPLCFHFERTKWPEKFRLKLIIQLFLIAFGGVTLFQSLFLKGIKLTSPALATAMPNLAPALIFVIAWTLRLERVKLSCTYSKVKIMGTLLCVVGAVTTSLLQSTLKQAPELPSDPSANLFDKEKIKGCLYLMAAVFVMSSNIVLQATALGEFPAPMSLCAVTSLIGVLTTVVVQLIQDHDVDLGLSVLNIKALFAISLLGGVVNGVCVSFNGWALKKRGPVLVSVFNPIATVISVILSALTLGEFVNIGSLAGMFLLFTGLYFVLWAKAREGHTVIDNLLESEYGPGMPLLKS